MWRALAAGIVASFIAGTAVAGTDTGCSNNFDSTFAAIQKVIFENRGCTSSVCHGSLIQQGGLDLRPEAAYGEIFQVKSETVPESNKDWYRIFPGERDRSLLWQNVAAKTLPSQFTAPLHPMPPDPLPALSTNELEALRLWIEADAPITGTVRGTAELLDACLPPEKPIEIEPLPPPPADEGVQIHMPRWIVKANSEREVCYASYYDLTGKVPADSVGPDGTIRFKQVVIRQNPLTHHLIVNLYRGQALPTDDVWQGFKCRGGAMDGETCDPTDMDFCGPDSGCANEAQTSIACFGQTNLPPDAQTGINAAGFTGTQKAADTVTYGDGVYNEIPLQGMIIWNSHAFNLTDTDGSLQGWMNLYFAKQEDQLYPVNGIFLADPPILFKTNVPPFKADEVCNNFTFPRHSQLAELSSHMHQRGKRWRTWEGLWQCDGGPNAGKPCSPVGPDEEYHTTDLCPDAHCTAPLPPKTGDCDEDLKVTISELILGVNIVLDRMPVSQCDRFDMDGDKQVNIADLIAAVNAASQPELRDPDDSLLYTNYIYNDPTAVRFDPPKAMGAYHTKPAERSVTYCALYDNGLMDPETVKKKSTSPPTPLGIPLGGPCRVPSGCTAGLVGEACSGSGQDALDASCDSTEGAGDGVCDACVLTGGVTTEDEMFLLLGWYYVNK